MIRVTIRRQDSSQDEIHEFALPQITVGRVDRNHVVLPNNRVSSVHARVLENEEGIVLVDNNSTNGTFVNGELVRGPVVLAPHDAVDIGVFTLYFERAEEVAEIHEIQEDGQEFGAGPQFEDEPRYGDPGEYEEFAGGPAPLGEPPDLMVPAEPTPADPIAAHEFERANPHALEQIGPPGSGSFRIAQAGAPELSPRIEPRRTAISPRATALDPRRPVSEARMAAVEPRATPVEPRHTEPDPEPEPPRSLDDALEMAFRRTAEALLGEPPGPQAHVRALAVAREVVERCLTQLDARQRRQWADWLAAEVAGTGPLTDILADTAVSEVLVSGANHIEVRRGEQRVRHPARFSCEQAVGLAIERLIGTRPTSATPILDAVTDAGAAVHVVGRPIAAGGPILVLTRAAGETMSLAELGERKVLSPPAAELLVAGVQRGLNILVCASIRADATAVLGALASELPGEARVVAVHRSPLAPALASRALVLDAGRDAAATIRSAARMRPDWLFVQDVGGVEVSELCATARRAGGATVASLAADGVEGGLERLQATLALASPADPSRLRAYVAGCFDLVIAVRRSLTGRDIVAQIAEIRRGDLVELFARTGDDDALQSTGVTPSIV